MRKKSKFIGNSSLIDFRNMKPSIFRLLLVASVLISFSAKAQPFDSLLNKLNTEYPQEKIYLHFDKSSYNPGETIWFKAYIFSGTLPSQISKSFYAELLDAKGNVLQRKINPVVMSSGAAAFDLPDSMDNSILYVRAYTKWMLGFDSSYLFTKAIPINIAKKTVSTKKGVQQQTYYLQFFPEGGDLINGLESRVAFKATDRYGMPIKVKGEIVDAKGSKIASFASVHDGMGYFTMTPDAGSQYKAVWKDPVGANEQTNLPAAKNSGASLLLDQTADAIKFVIHRSGGTDSSYDYMYVVAQLQQQLLYRAKANLAVAPMTSGMIPTKDLPAGIVQVTLFTKTGIPVAERIVFVNHQDYYFITDLNSALKDMGKKKKNVIQIDVPDTIPCNLSVSVTDASLNVPPADGDDITSHLLLTSDIKGFVYNPTYYFSSDEDSIAAHLDLVMMTNGWRRFKWDDLLAGRWPKVALQPEDYITVSGNIIGLTRSQMADKELNEILIFKNGAQSFMNTPLEKDGGFKIPGLIFYDTAKLYYQINNDKNKVLTSKMSVRFDNNIRRNYLNYPLDSFEVARFIKPDSLVMARNKAVADRQIAQNEFDQKNSKTLSTIKITAKKKTKLEEMDELYTTAMFRSMDEITFLTEDDPFAINGTDVLTYLKGKVAGLQITGTGAQATMSWRGGTPDLFMNEMQVQVDAIQTINMSDVAMIKVFRPPFFGATGGGGSGAIAVYTKKGKALTDNVKGLDFISIPGYSPRREFYSPDYLTNLEIADQPDFRTTLYWNPFVLTGKDRRRIYLTFFNNDFTKKFRVVVEGVNADGKVTRIEKVFE
ncbi:MAG: hypothetical protein C5B52_17725 [Bacteroidetes bacterium]|nr:MAG: hypothetical protein C5B52_17725 [Bacteroidota bacterium]